MVIQYEFARNDSGDVCEMVLNIWFIIYHPNYLWRAIPKTPKALYALKTNRYC